MQALSTELYSEKRPQIAKVRYTHDAMIDLVIARPEISQNQIAAHFGYTPSWVSTVFASEAFQERMAQRKEELVDPFIRRSVEERMKALVIQSLGVLQEKLEQPGVSADVALEAFKASTKALGYGARPQVQNVERQYIVHVPQKALSSGEWEREMHTVEGEVVPQGA